MKKLVLVSLITLLAANPVAAFNWQTAKKYIKPTVKATAAIGAFALAYQMGRLTVASGSMLNEAIEVAEKSNNPSVSGSIAMLGGTLSAFIALPSAIATLSTSILGGWLVKSAYDDAKKAYSRQ